jgi:hypothetical protein
MSIAANRGFNITMEPEFGKRRVPSPSGKPNSYRIIANFGLTLLLLYFIFHFS